MHFHLPKPLHGWREFAGEVGIIVIGVLIALGAEQLVESWHWHQKVGVVRASIMRELGNDRARWEQTMRDSSCMLADIDRLESWAAASPSRPEPRADFIHTAPLLWMHWANWDLAKSSQTLDHFPLDEQIAFATAYDGIVHRQLDLEKATDQDGRVLSLLPSASDPQDRRELLVTLRDLRGSLSALVSNNGYMTRHFDALGVKPDRSDFAADMRGAPVCNG